MTATTTSPKPDTPTTSPAAAFSGVMSTALDFAAAKVDDWTTKLVDVAAGATENLSGAVDDVADDLAEDGGAQQQAGVRGVQAAVQGNNPVWAAVKGAWAGGSTTVKAAIVAAAVTLVLLLVLSPVLLLVFLLSVLIVVVVSKVRSAKK